MALGATGKTVIDHCHLARHGIDGAGLTAGAVIAWSVTRAMSALLYGVDAGDPVTFAAVLGLLGIVAVAACAIPAIRAARLDPMLVLRDQ